MKSMNRVLVLLAALALLMVGAFAEDAGTPAEVLPAATAAEATAAEATAAEATPAELADDAVVAIANGIEITRQEVVTYAQLMQSYGYLNSALDYESEMAFRNVIQSMSGNAAVVLIAHRLATVRMASRAVVLEGGEVVEQGAIDALVAREGGYLAGMVALE